MNGFLSANGFLNVLKPTGMTSHDVVAWLRHLCRERVGHGGTLDPGAAGVLVLCLGRATRLSEFLLEGSKAYRAEVILGALTPTQDRHSPPEEAGDASCLTATEVAAAVGALTGEIEQVPPMTSALRHQGARLYELSRRGREVPRSARRVMVYRAELVDFWPGPRARALVDLECSHGTYVRTWCADLGDRLGVGGYMGFLVRTRVGGFPLRQSHTVEEIAMAEAHGRLGELVEPMGKAVSHLPALVMVRDRGQLAAGHMPEGAYVVPAEDRCEGQRVRVVDPQGELLAIARWEREGEQLFPRPEKVLVPAPTGR